MVFPSHHLIFKVDISAAPHTTPNFIIVKDVESIEPKLKGENKTWNPLDQAGWQRALNTGKSMEISHKGKRNQGDPGNDFIFGLMLATGNDCTVPYQIVFPDGAILSGNVVVDIATPFGGASTDLSGLEWTAIFDGKPDFTSTTPPVTLAMTSVPLNAATAVASTANIVLTFTNAIASYFASLVNDTTDAAVAYTPSLDATKKILTINPNADLTSGSKYVLVIAGATDVFGNILPTQFVYFTVA